MSLQCCRCLKLFRRINRNSLQKGICFAVCGVLFYLLLAVSPLLTVSLYGRFRASTLHTGPDVFDMQQLWMVGAVVFMTTLAMPFIKLALMLAVLAGLRLNRPPAIIADCFRWAKEVTKWSMLEVYLLGFLVAYTRLQALVFIHIGVAVYALIGVVLASTLMDAVLDSEAVWEKMEKKGLIPPVEAGTGLPAIGCELCHRVSIAAPGTHCPRCGAALHPRKPDSLQRTWALAISAAVFYIPANYFPVMYITRLDHTAGHTIIGGMLEFVQAGMWPLALLVFVASIVIPLLKLAALAYMLIETHRNSDKHLLAKTRLYRLIDFIGRWSMVDVFMVSILIGLVRFGQIAEIRSGIGAACFATVVVLTLLAVNSFDSRLMWDRAKSRPHSSAAVEVPQ